MKNKLGWLEAALVLVIASVFILLFVIFIVLLVLWSFLYSWNYYRSHEATLETI